MIRDEYCTYEIAKALYALGYDYASLGSYTDKDTFNFTTGGLMYRIISFPPDNPDFCLAPLKQQAFRWLREKYNYMHTIEDILVSAGEKEGYRFRFCAWKILDIYNDCILDKTPLGFLTYEEAELECLKAIINKIKK